MPAWNGLPHYRPQLALLVARPPRGRGWIHELKLDGYRIGVFVSGGEAVLVSRSGNDWTGEFPEIARAARSLGAREAALDGEVVALTEQGASSFQALQNRARSGAALVYYAFDLLRLDGEDLASAGLDGRKLRLRRLLEGAPKVLRYVQHFEDEGEVVFRHACSLRAEGIVSKRRDAPYRPGARHPDWRKVKCTLRQEFVVGGYTDPSVSRRGVGSLLLGHVRGRLAFAGKVSTGLGWGDELGRELRARLQPLEQAACPFEPPPPGWLRRNARWLRPELVAEVEFTEWTAGGHVRHPVLRGFRADKPPSEVVRETPVDPDAARDRAASGRSRARRVGGRPAPARDAGDLAVDDPDALVYPALGVTKLDLLRFYAEIAPWALPHLERRPLTVVRRREPITREDALRTQCRFVRHTAVDNRFAPAWIPRLRIPEKQKVGEYLWIDSPRALLALVAAGAQELHVWNATVEDVERPDRVVFDLDPGEGAGWARVVELARSLRGALGALGLESWPKATGGKGLHVVAPFRRELGWGDVFAFARAFADACARARPDLCTTAFAKSDRRGRVLLDYKRNYRTSIAVAPFSTRARPGGPVSAPLAWREVTPRLAPDRFDVGNLPERLRRQRSDPWRELRASRQRLGRGLGEELRRARLRLG